MSRFYKFFDGLGEFITSMAIVIILLIPFMWYRYYEFSTLFNVWLPIEEIGDKHTAATMISLVFICITVLFMVNVKRLFKGINLILAGTSFTLNMFFWSLNPDHNIWFVIFISAVMASMDYGLSHLFDTMWRERNQTLDLAQLTRDYEHKKKEKLILQDEVHHLAEKMKEYDKKLKECTCPHCGDIFTSWQAVNSHKNRCSLKPIKS